jgi:DNA-binding NtrC family response regulator
MVEDDEALRSGLAAVLESEGWAIQAVGTGAEALARLATVDVLVTDLRLPDCDGLDLLRQARERASHLEMIIMTAYGSVPSAVEAMRRGARAYLSKPFDPDELVMQLREVDVKLKLRDQAALAGRGELVGVSAAMERVYADIDDAAASLSPVLITGETGTGKEVAARAVHDLSAVRDGSFVAVNLGALPRELVESELFGHERGAFTGAHARKKGRFELAHRGTLFLDEVDALPIELQPKLLRALETREIWPLGAEKPLKVEARIVAATNARVEELIAAEKFRKDLFFRLNVIRIEMPSLHERPEDIPVIARALLNRFEDRLKLPSAVTVASDALSALVTREWGGNVRELANFLERGVMRAAGASGGVKNGEAAGKIRLELRHLDPARAPGIRQPFRKAKAAMTEEWTRSTLASALEECGGSATEAARRLQMGRTAFLRLVKKLRIRG